MQTLEAEAFRVAKGNDVADTLAKAAAELDAGFGREAALSEVAARVKWAVNYISWWHASTSEWPEVVPKALPGPEDAAAATAGLRGQRNDTAGAVLRIESERPQCDRSSWQRLASQRYE